MTCSIEMGPNDDLLLRTPSGRAISIPVGAHSTQLLWKVIWSSTQEQRRKPAGVFPTQHVVDKWAQELMPQVRASEREEEAAQRLQKLEEKYELNLNELDFDI